MIRKIVVFLTVIFFTSNVVRAQVEEGLWVKGHVIQGGNSVVSVQSGKELKGGQGAVLELDASGRFDYWVPKRSKSDHISIVAGGEEIAFYTLGMYSIFMEWSKDDLYRSLKISHNNGKPDLILKKWIVDRVRLSYEKFDALDSCRDSKTYFSVLQQYYHKEYDLLKNDGKSFSDEVFNRYATDIFYVNMNIVVTGRFFSEFDFSSGLGTFSFPPITLLNKKLEEEMALNWEIRKKNVVIDSGITRNLSNSEILNRSRSVYNIMDPSAFEKTVAYKGFISSYISDLASQIYYRGLQPSIRTSVSKYADFLNSLNLGEKITKWLIASEIERGILGDKEINGPELRIQLKILSDTDLEHELLQLWEARKLLVAGSPAPNFSYRTVEGKIENLTDYKGRFIYLNFWDSHCSPCISDIVGYSKTVSELYKNMNVVFLNISLDKDDLVWKKSLEKYRPSGLNGRINEGWSGLPVKLYSIRAIPRHIIVDPEGKIKTLNAGQFYDLLKTNPFK
jgi:thiol-disulfide isomerase/thioredoxin